MKTAAIHSRSVHKPLIMSAIVLALVLGGATAATASTSSPVTDKNASGVSAIPTSRTHLSDGSELLGPIPATASNYPFGSFAQQPSTVNLASYGYEEQEFFLSGTATSYVPASPAALSPNGQWAVVPDTTAPYATRLLVERPKNPRAFNGTVVVEWTNVSAGADVPVDFDYMHQYLLSAGYAVVEVSAQYVGIKEDKQFNPQRYESLSDPGGDSYSYDIFTQAGHAVPAALTGLNVRTLLADGESQSAARMVTYIDAIQPLAKVYDGFLVHSRGATGAPLSQPAPGSSSGSTVTVPTPSLIRTDLTVPVLQFETETDVVGRPAGLGFITARQPDNPHLRTWETAGTSHVDQYFFHTSSPIMTRDIPDYNVSVFACAQPYNDGQEHYVLDAAVSALTRWVAGDAAPAHSPQLVINSSDTNYLRDALGNAVGGIRTPSVDVPVSALSGIGNTPANPVQTFSFCFLFGTTTPFTSAQLKAVYPTHGSYVSRVAAAAEIARLQGFLLPAGVRRIIQAAAESNVP
jgi:hypothetical protein